MRPVIDRSMHRMGRPLSVAIAVSTLWLFSIPVNANEYGYHEYTYGMSNCSVIKDPLNLFYQFNLATSDTMTQTILNWDWDVGSTQYFNDTGSCEPHDRQRKSTVGPPNWHARMEWSSSNAGMTASPMHHDILSFCGDVADSFNSARNKAKDKYQAAGYFVPYTYTANNLAITQCDGLYHTASDGYFARVYQ